MRNARLPTRKEGGGGGGGGQVEESWRRAHVRDDACRDVST